MNDIAPPGFHRHKCFSCDWVWQHADTWRGSDRAHECPCCNKMEKLRCDLNEPLSIAFKDISLDSPSQPGEKP